MPTLYNWEARQSGGAVRVEGHDSAGRTIIVRDIHRIRATRGVLRTTTFAYNRAGTKLARLV